MRQLTKWAAGAFAGASLALLVAGAMGAFGSGGGKAKPSAKARSHAVATAKATLATASGYTVSGKVTFIQRNGNGSAWLSPVQVVAVVQGLPPGKHGFHIHAVGNCTPTSGAPFTNAGGHFDTGGSTIASTTPAGDALHYSYSPVEANHPFHAGDLPNLVAGPGGIAILVYLHGNRFTLNADPTKILDSDGAAVVVHELEDKGLANSTATNAGGGRIACGVIQ